MTWAQIVAALLISIAGRIIAADPALSLDKLAHYNAYLAIRLVVSDGRSAHENIFFSDLAAFENNHSVQFCRSFAFYVAALKYNIIYNLNLIKLEMSLPCCFLECAISDWVGGIDQWEEDALSTLKNQHFESLASLSPKHFNLLQGKIDRIKSIRLDFYKRRDERALVEKFFEHEKACLARSNIDIYMSKPFPTWAPSNEISKSREWLERRDYSKQKKRRKEYEKFWEQLLLAEKIRERYRICVYFSYAANLAIMTIRKLPRKFREIIKRWLNLNTAYHSMVAYLLGVKEPMRMTDRSKELHVDIDGIRSAVIMYLIEDEDKYS